MALADFFSEKCHFFLKKRKRNWQNWPKSGFLPFLSLRGQKMKKKSVHCFLKLLKIIRLQPTKFSFLLFRGVKLRFKFIFWKLKKNLYPPRRPKMKKWRVHYFLEVLKMMRLAFKKKIFLPFFFRFLTCSKNLKTYF